MKNLYASPLRVYLCLGALALAGIFAGTQLPVSLFPNSSKPIIMVGMSYGNNTANEFIQQHGNRMETQLRAIDADNAQVEKTRSYYNQEGMRFEVEFKWGTPPRAALKEVETVIHAYSSQLPEEVRNQIWIQSDAKDSGFFVASFYSASRSLDDLYKLVEPVLMPEVTQLKDVAKPLFWNPTDKEVRIEMNSERMSAFQLLPKDVEESIQAGLAAFNGGSITIGLQQLSIELPRRINKVNDLDHILITPRSKQAIHLADIAKVNYDLKTLNASSFKTSGSPSIILFARPRPGGNIKRMSEEINRAIETAILKLPKDIEYKVLVDPSNFIRSAINNVFHEVAIGAFLAVLVLFIFIGSFKNTVTAAIEIPLSMILAFIPMKLSGMSINLISLGGLALSAGMNVDASVVVMENIFRHFERHKGHHDFSSKLTIVVRAVNEVKFAVIGSTIASLVVFIPLAFTSDLTYAILGDLAKAVVFSHGFSAIVALVLVPTVRLQLMSKGGDHVSHSPIEKQITRIETSYVNLLNRFIRNKKFQNLSCLFLTGLLILLCTVLIPRLPKEVIGKPDTEDMMINISTQGNTLLKQMEDIGDQVEQKLLRKFGKQIQYTLVSAESPNQSWIMAHLKNKAEMNKTQKELEAFFTNTPLLKYTIAPFNPAELPIPDPPQLRLAIRGGELSDRADVTRDIYQLLDEAQLFPRLWTEPSVSNTQSVILSPYLDVWSNLKSQGSNLNPNDLADLVRVMTTGRKIGEVMIDDYKKDIFLRYDSQLKMEVEQIGAIPIGLGTDLVPLKALSQIKLVKAMPSIYQENQRDLFLISGKLNSGDSLGRIQERLDKAKTLVDKWKATQGNKAGTHGVTSSPIVTFEDAGRDVNEAMEQLIVAVLLSIVLIFFILLIQFGDMISALLVLVAIPLGIIGVLLSLFIFKSTLSLNSILGVILLNGIAVANSILLVDFLRQRIEEGLKPIDAALEAARQRIRPILITSLTTILGMLPIAMGLGEGGKILQPLGIAVSGGLWVSMTLTLFIVPALQVRYLDWKKS